MEPKKKNHLIRESPMTYDEYAQMSDDGNRYEIADGVLELMSPAPSLKHQAISGQLQFTLMSSCQSEYIILSAPFDLILSDTEVRQPDLAMVHRSRLSILKNKGIVGAPDLVVEILSPSSIKRDKLQKLKAYAKYGIPEYWIVDGSNQTMEQCELVQSNFELTQIYQSEEPVRSSRIRCVNFTMNEIFSRIPDIPD